jgi:transposase
MSEYTRFVGFDVSAETIAVAVAEAGRAPVEDTGVLAADPAGVRKWVMRQPDRATLLVCYEAGPTGFGLQRQLAALGVACQVIAPGLVPTRPTDRIKTDRRDARHLADALRAGTLTPVRVPTEVEEAFRDLVRARTMAVQVRQRARQRVKSTLLRWGLRPPGNPAAWGPGYRAWLQQVTPTPAPRDQVWAELLSQLEEADTRVDRLTRQTAAAWPTHPLAPLMRAWQGLRGVDWLTAATLAAELGDLATFPQPRHVMAWVGLVPSEASSGVTRHQGGLTKTGNAHLRRILVEAAHSYRFRPRTQGLVGRRLAALGPWEPAVSAISWRAQQRLHVRLRTLQGRRGTPKAIAAVARELCGYLWDMAVWVRVQPPGEVPPAA